MKLRVLVLEFNYSKSQKIILQMKTNPSLYGSNIHKGWAKSPYKLKKFINPEKITKITNGLQV